MEYTFRKSVLENAKTYRLDANMLVVSAENSKSFSLPFDNIDSIRLYYSPHRFKTHNYNCRITHKGGILLINSSSYDSFGEFSDNRYEYNKFVRALVAAVEAKNTNLQVYAGNMHSTYWFYVFITTVTVLGLAALFSILPIAGGFGFIIGLILVAFYLFYSLKMFIKNYPKQITADSIPEKVLPQI